VKSELIQTLSERGFIHQATNLDGLDTLASTDKITSYTGFDLTADSLHVGSLVQIMVQRWMAKLGHNPLTLLGEATTRIGDPSGKSTQRPMLSHDAIAHNREGIENVLDRLLIKKTYVSNSAWFNDSTSFFEFLHDYGQHFTINRMLTFESVKSRLDAQSPLTFLDFLKLHENEGCMLQVGGSDQWGNIVNGIELVRRIDHEEVFGLTTPLMTNVAGQKMGKTASGAVWLDPDKTSAFEFWQFWRNIEDAKVSEFLRLFTELPMDEIARLDALEGHEINDAKKILATEVTTLVHGRSTAEHAALLAAGGCLDHNVDASMKMHTISAERFAKGITLAQILLDTGLVASKTEAAKMASNNGVRLNGNTIVEVRETLPRDAFENDSFMLSVGKKKVVAVKIGD
jgi:tyrosyl-tRNA synthetase